MDLPPDESANLEELEAFSKVIIMENYIINAYQEMKARGMFD